MEDQSGTAPAAAGPFGDGAGALPPVPVMHRFEFSGDAREYFRIWIVNLALGILTLGIYSAWAKVRTQRYFYSNTRVAGSPFEYLAKPLPILKGRLIAVALFAGYVVLSEFSPVAALVLALLIALATPWLVVRGLMFRARYSSWRGLSFRFVGDYGQAIQYFFLIYLLVPLTLGLIWPYIKCRQKAFVVDNHRFGGRRFRFGATGGQFFEAYFVVALAFVGVIVLMMLTLMLLAPSPAVRDAMRGGHLMAYLQPVLVYLMYFLGWTYLTARINNLAYNHSTLDAHRFVSTLRARDLAWIYASNTVAILASAGMLIPWAMVRLARYRAEHLQLAAHGDLDGFGSESTHDVGAAASEMDGFFDVDIGL